jgi:hypothetical protein
MSASAKFATTTAVPSERGDFTPKRRATASPTMACPIGVDTERSLLREDSG